MSKLKVLVDTDVGTDADDAVCLAYLLRHPRCEVQAVTTVGRDAGVRARLAEAVCRRLGREDVPIAAGTDAPMFPNRYWWHHTVNQAHVADRFGAATDYPTGRALELMRRTIREHPGEIVLLTLGMLSNAAVLVAGDPETAGMLKEIVVMGGRFDYPADAPRTECNVMLDPTAAGTLFTHETPPVRVVSLDSFDRSTGERRFTGGQVERHLAGEALGPVLECCRRWGKERPSGGVGLADPATAAAMLDPDAFTWHRGRVGVRLYDHDLKTGDSFDGDQVTGATHFTPDEQGPHLLARDGDLARLKADIVKVLETGETA